MNDRQTTAKMYKVFFMMPYDRTLKTTLQALAFILAVFLALPAHAQKPDLRGDLLRLNTAEAGKAIDFSFLQQGVTPLRVSTLKGKVLVINLWATWCAPCIKELPSLGKLETLRGGSKFMVIGINLDINKEIGFVKEFLDKNQIGYFALNAQGDDGGEAVDIQALPSTIIVDAQGKLVGVFEGETDWASEDALAFVDSLLKN